MQNDVVKKEKIKALQLVLVVGSTLTLLKFTAYYFTHSAAILTDALESIVNIVACIFALYSIYYSSKSRDTDHPYGHGKIEYISAGFEGGLVFLAGLLIMYEAVENLLIGHLVQKTDIGLYIMSAAGLVIFVLGNFLVKKGKKYHSLTLIADGKHLLTDSYTSIGIVVGLALIWLTGFNWIDSVLAIIYSGFIIFTGFKLMRQALDGLMDKIDFAIVADIIKVLNEHRSRHWIDIHNMRLQKFGSHLHVDCHVTLAWYENLEHAHLQMESIADLLNEHFENRVEFFIHPDPCTASSCGICQIENCKERKNIFEKKLDWTLENVLENKAHTAH